jgi:hypothetical protein
MNCFAVTIRFFHRSGGTANSSQAIHVTVKINHLSGRAARFIVSLC